MNPGIIDYLDLQMHSRLLSLHAGNSGPGDRKTEQLRTERNEY